MSMSAKKIVLKSSDGETFEVEEAVALMSPTIKQMIEDGGADTAISLPNVTSKILSMVIEYCKKHRAAEEELESFDTKFVDVHQGTLFGLIRAANHLGIKSLLDLSCWTVQEMIRGKTPEEIRMFYTEGYNAEKEEEEVAGKTQGQP